MSKMGADPEANGRQREEGNVLLVGHCHHR